jgi:class 3 adenylate cyclase
MTVFGPVRAFATISEGLERKVLKTLMNESTRPLTEVIHRHPGTKCAPSEVQDDFRSKRWPDIRIGVPQQRAPERRNRHARPRCLYGIG